MAVVVSLRDFVFTPEIQLPLSWKDEDDFAAFVKNRFEFFLDLVHRLEPSGVKDELAPRLNDIESCCSALQSTIRSTFEGHPNEAYQHFDTAITAIRNDLDGRALVLNANDLRYMYRVRQLITPGLIREELFHIPFENRHLVATRRYSIPGLPCLYLCGSLYACWEELGRPPLHELQVAAFWLKDACELKILDFSHRPLEFQQYLGAVGAVAGIDNVYKRLISHTILWPLVAACSILVKHPNAPFKPEYLIPQIVLQWVVKNKDVDGICYFSTHIKPVSSSLTLATCNFVFPAKEIKASGRCSRLRDCFKMTQPISWELLRAVRGSGAIPTGLFDFEFVEGCAESYTNTEFGVVQSKLAKLANDIKDANANGDLERGDVLP